MGVDPLLPVLAACMIATGAANTLLTKYQDMQCVRNCDSPNPADRELFEQPVIQTLQMLLGEGLCCWTVIAAQNLYLRLRLRLGTDPTSPSQHIDYVPVNTDDPPEASPTHLSPEDDELNGLDVYDPSTVVGKPPQPVPSLERLPLEGWNTLLLALPVSCDICGTTIMQIGLLFIAASIYQMTRGALVLFVGLFSVLFLRRHLGVWKWMSLFIVVVGIAIVGLAGTMEPGPGPDLGPTRPYVLREVKMAVASAGTPLLGVILVAGAQVFTAAQFCIEESILGKYKIDPIRMVSWEGTFGIFITSVGIVILHLAVGMTEAGKDGYFDAVNGFRQVFASRALSVSSIFVMISIAGFNFFGVTITKRFSASARSTLDSCRTLAIWLVSLGLGWETFKWLQVIGFILVVYGTGVFNELIREPTFRWLRRRPQT